MRKIRLPKKLKKAKGRVIEVRMPMTPNEVAVENLPHYQVRDVNNRQLRDVNNGWHKTIAYVSSRRRYKDGREQDRFILDHEKDNDGQIEYVVNVTWQSYSKIVSVEGTVQESDDIAHRTAVGIALQIADYSNLPLEDLSREDKVGLERSLREIKEQAALVS